MGNRNVTLGALMALALLVPVFALASIPPREDIDFVKERLVLEGYTVENLELELNLKPRHQLSHLFAPAANLAQRMFSSDFVTMKYYDLHFTSQGLRYECVVSVGNNEKLSEESRYVGVESCEISKNEDGVFLRPKVVQLKSAPNS